MNLADRLRREFAERRRRNPHYSLRAFARDLATSHASLSQILREQRRVSLRLALRLGRRAGIAAEEISAWCATQLDELVLRAIRSGSFQPASRWIAVRTGLPLDEVNGALVRLLRRGAITMESPKNWRVA
jgi:hypothetical protein